MKKNIYGLLIAAGYSSRMGVFKPLLKYQDQYFVIAIIQKMLRVCENVIIVTGYNNEVLEREISSKFSNRIKTIYNQNYELGMFSSLQSGLNEMVDSDWILYHFVDQPFHSDKFYYDLISAIDDNYDWIQPMFEATEGHPVLFNRIVRNMIINCEPNYTLMKIRNENILKKKIWNCSYPLILKDIDTPSDLEQLKIPIP